MDLIFSIFWEKHIWYNSRHVCVMKKTKKKPGLKMTSWTLPCKEDVCQRRIGTWVTPFDQRCLMFWERLDSCCCFSIKVNWSLKKKNDRNCYLAISQSQSSRHFWCIFSKCYYVTFVLCSTYGWFSNLSFYTAVAFPFFHKCLYVSLLSFMLTIVVVAIYIHRVMFIRRKRRRRQSKEQ